MRVVQREDNTLKFAVVELEHPQMKYRNVEVHAVPIIGRRHYYRALKDRLDQTRRVYEESSVVLNATVEDDFARDSDSTNLGNGYWSDLAHVTDHSVLDETIPYSEYTSAKLKVSELLPLMRRQKDRHLKSKEKANKIFDDFDGSYESKKTMSYVIGIMLRYKYSSFCFAWSEYMYPKAYDRIAQQTVNVLLSVDQDTEIIQILVDPYAFNATVKALKGIGYKPYFDFYNPYITLV
jgi:hypothetical protein